MGLIKAAKGAIGGVLADQWKEYFYCDSLSSDVLMTKGEAKISNKGRSSNTKGNDNIISNGSIVSVNEGQFMIIVEQGRVVEFCGEAGEFQYNTSTEPSLFTGPLGQSIKDTFKTLWGRFGFGGDTGKDQRVYYFNTKEILNNKFGTPSPIPFRVLDTKTGLDIDTQVKCNGQYTFKITNPLLFYKNVCANVTTEYRKDQLLEQMRSEMLTALQPALGTISALGIRPYELPAHTGELTGALKEQLTSQWTELRGIEMVSVGINSADIPEEDRARITKWQETAVLTNPGMAAARQTEAFTGAIENMGGASGGESGSAMNGAMGMMGMAMMNQMMGGNMLGGVAAVQNAQASAPLKPAATVADGAVLGWTCSCGQADNKGKFCSNCGLPKPALDGWTCSCGHVNQGNFCQECGRKKPAGAPLYRCNKCGWEPEDPMNPPRFCPECGDPFDDGDIVNR